MMSPFWSIAREDTMSEGTRKAKIEIPKDWCERMAQIEGDAEIGAGILSGEGTMSEGTHDVVALLPCPFCGGEAEVERVGDFRQSTIYSCKFCGCSLETGEEWGHGKRWNVRVESALSTENTRLREALEPFARAVFNDNGDVTISTGGICVEHYMRARAALSPAQKGEA